MHSKFIMDIKILSLWWNFRKSWIVRNPLWGLCDGLRLRRSNFTIFYSSKCTARSRSASADGLLDSCILDENDLNHNVGSCDSILEHDDLLKCATKLDSPRSPKAGPRICKPEEKFQQQPETDIRAIRGRRKPLYSTPTNRSTMPPQIPPKPAIGIHKLLKIILRYQWNLVSVQYFHKIFTFHGCHHNSQIMKIPSHFWEITTKTYLFRYNRIIF